MTKINFVDLRIKKSFCNNFSNAIGCGLNDLGDNLLIHALGGLLAKRSRNWNVLNFYLNVSNLCLKINIYSKFGVLRQRFWSLG